jgi:hypothetical protein
MAAQSETSYADWTLKFGGIGLAFIYSLGFLVVARHLSRYGVSSFSVFQIQYLVAGIWTASPPILLALVQRTAERFKDNAYALTEFSWSRFFLVFAVVGIPLGLLLGASVGLLGGAEGLSWSLAVRLWLSYLLLSYPADLAWISWHFTSTPTRWWLNRQVTPFYLTIFGLAMLLYAVFFAGSFYPMIPASLGGGKPRTIVFIPAKGGLPVGIIAADASGRSVPYDLLTATDKSYFVVSPVPNEESIEISRESVQGIVVLKEGHPPKAR